MRTDELRSSLHRHGEEVHDRGARARVTAVHDRVRTVRRRRAALGGAGLLTAAVAVGLAVVPGPASPPENTPAAPTVVFPGEVGGRQLLGAAVGDPGTTEVTFRAAAPAAGSPPRLSPVCYGPLGNDYAVSMSVNGTVLYGLTCDTEPPADPAAPGLSSGEEIADAFEALDLEPGSPMRVRVWLRPRALDDDRVVTDPEMVVGGAVYGEPVREAGDDQAGDGDYTVNGVTYRGEVAGERLLGAAIGARGEPEVAFDVTVGTTGLRFSPLCYGVGTGYQVNVAIDQHLVTGRSCHVDKVAEPGVDGVTFAEDPTRPLREWGIRPGDTVTVEAWVSHADDPQRQPATHAEVIVGVGIYEDRHLEQPLGWLELPRTMEHEGRLWTRDAAFDAVGERTLRGTAGDPSRPVLVVVAADGLHGHHEYTVSLDGEVVTGMGSTGVAGPSWQSVAVVATGDRSTVRVRVVRGMTERARLAVALYHPAD